MIHTIRRHTYFIYISSDTNIIDFIQMLYIYWRGSIDSELSRSGNFQLFSTIANRAVCVGSTQLLWVSHSGASHLFFMWKLP